MWVELSTRVQRCCSSRSAGPGSIRRDWSRSTAAHCGLPLYWPAPQFIISPKAGMHRFSWDLKFDPVSPVDLIPAGDEEATGAVPGRTYPNYNVPWVPPGSYRVRLSAEGKSSTQPITVLLD